MVSASLKLHSPALVPVPLGWVQPEGWLRDQLRIQADGLSGHLDEFWPDIKNSQWFGGAAEGWERAPYWLDGVVPLAFLLRDKWLQDKVAHALDSVLAHQAEDGWLLPGSEKMSPEQLARYDIWGVFLMLKVLVQYHDATGDRRVPDAVESCLRRIERHIEIAPLFNWAQFRWFECLIAIYWLYERKPAPWLLKLVVSLQAQGFDWSSFCQRWHLTGRTETGRWTYMGHVVNCTMALKAPALWMRLTGEEKQRQASSDLMQTLERYHGTATGVITGDECLAGLNPSQGTELCAIVEYLYSLEIMASILGDSTLGDRMEKIAFNALPAAFSTDMWAHQYDQQVNQIECSVREGRLWTTNSPDANIFGLEPNYGCCTANFSQGFPKFAAHLWMKTPEAGLAAMAYAPNRLNARLGDSAVSIHLETGYPFRDELHLTVECEKPTRFPLLLRIPQWTVSPEILLDGKAIPIVMEGGFCRIEREWNSTTDVQMKLPMQPRLIRRYHHAASIERGPLVYALRLDTQWKRIHEDQPYRELPHADWEVYPTTAWNYALKIHEDTVSKLQFQEGLIPAHPFSPEGSPVSTIVEGKRLPEWSNENGSAGEIPTSPVQSSEPLDKLTLVPFGCTHLRIAEFPTLGE